MIPGNILQCINTIVQITSFQNDQIAVLSEESGFNFPVLRFNVRKPDELRWYLQPPNYYVFYNIDNRETEYFLFTTVNYYYWFKQRARFLIVGTNFSRDFISFIASYYIFDVTFLDIHSGKVLIYYPYKGSCLQKINVRVKTIGFCDSRISSLDKYDLFPPRIPQQWMNSSLKILYSFSYTFSSCVHCKSRYKGIESEIFITILKYLNINIIADKYYNQTYAERMLIEHKYDMIFGTQSVLKWVSNIDTTMSYVQEDIVYFVAIPQPLLRWKYYFSIFKANVWFSCLVTIMVISALWIWKTYVNDEKIKMVSFLETTISIFILFLGQSLNLHPKGLFHKILILCIIFLTTFMNFFFGTRLTYLLNGLNYGDVIDSLEKIKQNHLYIGGIGVTYMWASQSLETRGYPKRYYIDCTYQIALCMKRTMFMKDMAFVASVRETQRLEKREYHKALLSQIRPPLYSAKLVAFFSKGHPIFPTINKLLYSLVESGIVSKIVKRYDRLMRLYMVPSRVKKLNFDHMVVPFVLWFAGIFMALSFFLIEFSSLRCEIIRNCLKDVK
ncbi:hypothetical protein HHI36_007096 [Cryptolaemus montrouzieri]|uniref:Ionotropic receptor n=1 Tax=Cryptolaemus montrouzieri TaxID=559131 RepID=A0ABD2MNN5_9CUCU